MTNRIIKTYGIGVGEAPAEIIVTADSRQVYSGTVPTVTEISRAVGEQPLLFEFELPVETSGDMPMTYQVTSGSVSFAHMTANYVLIPNPIYTEDQLSTLSSPDLTVDEMITIYESVGNLTFTQEEKDLLASEEDMSGANSLLSAKNLSLSVNGGSSNFGSFYDGDHRDQVYIDGELMTPDRREDQLGTWFWKVNEGSTMTFNLKISAGVE